MFLFCLQWVTLEDVKTGMIHLELTWFNLMSDPVMLKMVFLKGNYNFIERAHY